MNTRSSDTATKILEAASALIAERGYAATTTREIARRAGVNEVTVFRHFENKAGVLAAIAQRFAERSAAHAMDSVPASADTRETLVGLARNEVAGSMENGGVALRLAFEAPTVPEVAALMGEGPAANLRALAAYFADRQRAGEVRGDVSPEVLAEAFASLTSSYVMFRAIMGLGDEVDSETADETVERLFDVFWSGARARERTGKGVDR